MMTSLEQNPQDSDTADYLSFDDLVSRFYEEEPRRPARVRVGGESHPGMVRPNNEDNFLVVRRRRTREVLAGSVTDFPHTDQEAYVLAVADGLGGHQFGEIASRLALRTGWDLGGGEIKWPVKLNEREAKELKEKARVFFQMLDQALHGKARENPELAGMGTTLTICYTAGPNLFVLHAGDSRAYLYRQGRLMRLTRDHTRAQELVDAGIAEEDSPQARRYRHVLTNCLGGPYVNVRVDVDQYELCDGDRLLLCTDGLSDLFTEEEMAETLSKVEEPAEACHRLVEQAMERGAPDNVTVVIGSYAFPDVEETLDLPRPEAHEAGLS